jgi:hypothetical protein
MLQTLKTTAHINTAFDRENLAVLSPYFDIDFLSASGNNRQQFFQNLKVLARHSLGLAHCIQHNAVARIVVQLSDCVTAKTLLDCKSFSEIIGCYSIVKRSDEIAMTNGVLSGTKKWFSNLDQADFGVLQIPQDGTVRLIYLDLANMPHKIDYSFFSPIGMEIARAGSLIIHDYQVPQNHVLGQHGTQQYFQQSNFASYCFLTNHCGIVQELFLDLKKYTEKFDCGSEFDIKKLEMDVATMVMQWEDNLATVDQQTSSNEFWNRRNTQYAFSKKTLIRLLQLILEVGVTYYTDSKSEFSQRFRDALTYASHMHPLYKFGQEFYMLDLEK